MFQKTLFLMIFLISLCGVQSIKQVQSQHRTADFIKLFNPSKLNLINDHIKLLRKEIKKLDENLNSAKQAISGNTALLIGTNDRLSGIETKLNQILTNTKPKAANLEDQGNRLARNRRALSNSRILVRSVSSNEYNHDEYTNEFNKNDAAWNEPERINSDFMNTVFDWQNRTDQRLNKIMNVLTEIFKEDKQLSLDLARLNEKQANENKTDTFDRIKKEFKEQFSFRNAELRGFVANINENCLSVKTQNDKINFLLLGIKDNLTNPQQSSKFNQENSVLPVDDETHLDTRNLIAKNELFCKGTSNIMNSTIELLRADLNNARQQIINKLDREHTRTNERILTLNNNYQNLNNLRNCNSISNGLRSNREPIDLHNEVDSQLIRSSRMTTVVVPLERSVSSTFIPFIPFYSTGHYKREDEQESRSKSNTRTKLINPIKYGQIRKRNCHIPNVLSPSSCEDLYRDRVNCDGVYVILLQDEAVRVYCEMDDNFGSTVIMRRGKFNDYPLTNFNQDWSMYRKGFGNIDADFWLGLDKIHELTKNKNQMLIIDLETFGGEQMTLKYNKFYIEDETNNFKLTIGEPDRENSIYANQFIPHNGASFVTIDRGNRFNCARKFESGWWFFDNAQCHSLLLNGVFYMNSTPMLNDGIQWSSKWSKQYLKSVQMKIRERK